MLNNKNYTVCIVSQYTIRRIIKNHYTNNYKHTCGIKYIILNAKVQCKFLTLRHLNETMCVCGGRKVEETRTLFTHTLPLTRHWHPTSHIGILALRCTLQLPMLKLQQTPREIIQSYSAHLYSVSFLETNEPCS